LINLKFIGQISNDELIEVQNWLPSALVLRCFNAGQLFQDRPKVRYFEITLQESEVFSNIFDLKNASDLFAKELESYIGVICFQNEIKTL